MDLAGKIVKFNAQTSGRDKLCRAFQYGSKFGWWYCDEILQNQEMVQKLKTLETSLSATRKVLKMGKSLDMIQGALKSMTIQDRVWRLTLTLSKLNQACYLFIDHYIWAIKIGLVKGDSKKWAKTGARFWLVTLVCSLIRNIYDVFMILSRFARARRQVSKHKQDKHYRNGEVSTIHSHHMIGSAHVNLNQIFHYNLPVWLDAMKNSTDLLLPMAALNYVNISPGTQGILGVISSVASMMTVWNSSLKLVPS